MPPFQFNQPSFDPNSALRQMYDDLNAGPLFRQPFGMPGVGRTASPTSPLNDREFQQYQKAEEDQGGIWNKALGGLHWLGQQLDKFGRPVRAALGGVGKLLGKDTTFDPSELLSWVPFSDTMGLTSDKNQTTMRNLLGYTEDQPLEWWQHVLNIGGDIATNPTSYFGGFGGGGKFAASGKTALPAVQTAQRGVPAMMLGSTAHTGGALTNYGKALNQVGGLSMSHLDRLAGLKGLGSLAEYSPEVVAALTADPKLAPLLTEMNAMLGAGKTVPLQGVARVPFTNQVIGANAGTIAPAVASGLNTAGSAISSAAHSIPGVGGMVGGGLDWLGGTARQLGRLLPDTLERAAVEVPLFGVANAGRFGDVARYGIGPHLKFFGGQEGKVIGDIQRGMSNQASGITGEGVGGMAVREARQAMQNAGIKNLESPEMVQVLQHMTSGMPLPPTLAHGLTAPQLGIIEDQLTRLLDQAGPAYKAVANVKNVPAMLDDTVLQGKRFWPERMMGPGVKPESGDMVRSVLGTTSQATLERTFLPNVAPHIKSAMVKDQVLKELANAQDLTGGVAHIMQNYVGPGVGMVKGNQAKTAYKFIQEGTGDYAKHGIDLYMNPLESMAQHLDQLAKQKTGVDATLKALALYAKPIGEVSAGGGGRNLAHALEELGMGVKGAPQQGPLLPGAQRLVGSGSGEALADTLQQVAGKTIDPEKLAAFGVDDSVIRAITKKVAATVDPASRNPFGRALDTYSALYKTGVTLPFPGYHAANTVGGAFSNLIGQTFDPQYGMLNPMRYLKPSLDARQIFKEGGQIENLLARAPQLAKLGATTDAEAMDALRRWMSSVGVTRAKGGLYGDVAENWGSKVAGTGLKTPEEAGYLLGTHKTGWNPLAVRGVWSSTPGKFSDKIGNAAVSEFKPINALEAVSSGADNYNRAAQALAKLFQGHSLENALQGVKNVHFDYRTLGDMEKNVLQRVFPFYGWTRMNAEAMARKAINEPGKMNALLKTENALSGPDTFIPESLRNALQVPGEVEEWRDPNSGRLERRQKFKQLLPMLPHEETLRMLDFGAGGGERMKTNLLEQMNPLAKMLYNSVAEKKLGGSDAYANQLFPEANEMPMGGNKAAWALLDSPGAKNAWELSPLSRVYSTIQGFRRNARDEIPLSDTIIGLLGGPKTRQVDLIGARERELREAITDYLGSDKNFVKKGNEFVLPQEFTARAMQDSPENMVRYRAYQTLQRLAQERGLQRHIEHAASAQPIMQELMANQGNLGSYGQRELMDAQMLQALLPKWRLDLQGLQNRRMWEAMMGGYPMANPYNAALQPQRQAVDRNLRIGLRNFL